MEAASASKRGRRPIEVGRVISESFSIYAAHAAPLLLSAFVIFVFVGVLQALLYDGGFLLGLLSSAVGLAAGALYTGFVVKLVDDVRDGRRDFSTRELFSSASGYIVPLIVNGFLRAFAVVIGLALFILPGLYLLTIWAVTSPAIAAEDEDAIGAFGRSNALVGNQKLPVFLTIAAAFLITIVASVIVLGIGFAIGTGALFALSIFASTVTAPISALVATVLFFDLGGGAAAASDEGQVIVEY